MLCCTGAIFKLQVLLSRLFAHRVQLALVNSRAVWRTAGCLICRPWYFGVCFSAGLSRRTHSILGFPFHSSTSLCKRYFSMGPQLLLWLLHWGVGVVAIENVMPNRSCCGWRIQPGASSPLPCLLPNLFGLV